MARPTLDLKREQLKSGPIRRSGYGTVDDDDDEDEILLGPSTSTGRPVPRTYGMKELIDKLIQKDVELPKDKEGWPFESRQALEKFMNRFKDDLLKKSQSRDVLGLSGSKVSFADLAKNASTLSERNDNNLKQIKQKSFDTTRLLSVGRNAERVKYLASKLAEHEERAGIVDIENTRPDELQTCERSSLWLQTSVRWQ